MLVKVEQQLVNTDCVKTVSFVKHEDKYTVTILFTDGTQMNFADLSGRGKNKIYEALSGAIKVAHNDCECSFENVK